MKLPVNLINDKNNNRRMLSIAVVIIATVINILMVYAVEVHDVPIFMGMIGTIAVASIAGLFPGICTAFATSVLCSFLNEKSIYFSIINMLIAIYTTWFVRKYSLKNIRKVLAFSMTSAVFSGLLSTFIQWTLLRDPLLRKLDEMAHYISGASGFSFLPSFLLTNILVNIPDKIVACIIVVILFRFISPEVIAGIEDGAWKQRPLSNGEIKYLRKWSSDIRCTVKMRNTLSLVVSSLIIVLAMGWIGISLYADYIKREETENAWNAVRFAAEMIDADRVEDYLRNGESAEGYNETKDILSNIKKTAFGVEYLYVMKFEEDGCHVVFDVDTDKDEGYKAGTVVAFEPAFIPHLNSFFEGKEVKPIESDDISGWVLTIYHPVRNRAGKTVCYAGADVSLEDMHEYIRFFVIKVVLMLSGVYLLVISYALWTSGAYSTYPISSMAACMDSLAKNVDDQEKLDENVMIIQKLGIHTGDEVEKLYHAICSVTEKTSEQLKNVRRLSDYTSKMQDGLILTMADMVDRRDTNTGTHVHKTSAYVKIIVEGLKKKGYYPEKLTEKYMSDVIRSAPLHDVGKIRISDTILNKHGKLTDEEFEIMKSHTTAGREIMENAISTVNGENYLKEARNMAAYHHERWDGNGYPEGLHGEAIPLSARIMAVADVFEALTSERVYKAPYSLEQAVEFLKEGAGSRFDAKCVEVFVDALPEVRVIYRKYIG